MALKLEKTDRHNSDEKLERESASEFPLVKKNFIFMAVSGALIVLGFLLMLGGGSTTEFNPDIFSARRIVVGPTIAFLGFVAMAVSIIVRPGKRKKPLFNPDRLKNRYGLD